MQTTPSTSASKNNIENALKSLILSEEPNDGKKVLKIIKDLNVSELENLFKELGEKWQSSQKVILYANIINKRIEELEQGESPKTSSTVNKTTKGAENVFSEQPKLKKDLYKKLLVPHRLINDDMELKELWDKKLKDIKLIVISDTNISAGNKVHIIWNINNILGNFKEDFIKQIKDKLFNLEDTSNEKDILSIIRQLNLHELKILSKHIITNETKEEDAKLAIYWVTSERMSEIEKVETTDSIDEDEDEEILNEVIDGKTSNELQELWTEKLKRLLFKILRHKNLKTDKKKERSNYIRVALTALTQGNINTIASELFNSENITSKKDILSMIKQLNLYELEALSRSILYDEIKEDETKLAIYSVISERMNEIEDTFKTRLQEGVL